MLNEDRQKQTRVTELPAPCYFDLWHHLVVDLMNEVIKYLMGVTEPNLKPRDLGYGIASSQSAKYAEYCEAGEKPSF